MQISIKSSANLTKIDRYSLVSLQDVIEDLQITKSNLGAGRESFGIESVLFDEISMLAHLKTLDLSENNLTFIPGGAFKNYVGKQTNLTTINLSNNQIASIGQKAFLNLPNLERLNLKGNSIINVASFAFAADPSETFVTIEMTNGFHGDAFGPLSLAEIRRPATLVLGGPEIKTLKQAAFSLYFLEHSGHNIFWDSKFNLTCDCGLYWLWAAREHFKERFLGGSLFCDGFSKTFWELQKEDVADCFVKSDV